MSDDTTLSRFGFDDPANLMAAQIRARQLAEEFEELTDQACVDHLREQLPEHLKRHFEEEEVQAIMTAARRNEPEQERQALLLVAGASTILDEHFG